MADQQFDIVVLGGGSAGYATALRAKQLGYSVALIEKEKLEEKDFVVPPLPHCSSKGTRREIICPISELSYKCDESGYKMHFALPKGNYATCLMREFMKSDMNSY